MASENLWGLLTIRAFCCYSCSKNCICTTLKRDQSSRSGNKPWIRHLPCAACPTNQLWPYQSIDSKLTVLLLVLGFQCRFYFRMHGSTYNSLGGFPMWLRVYSLMWGIHTYLLIFSMKVSIFLIVSQDAYVFSPPPAPPFKF